MTLHDGETDKKIPEKAKSARADEKIPPAGPHARIDLTNFDACPGSGVLPSPIELGRESDPGAG